MPRVTLVVALLLACAVVWIGGVANAYADEPDLPVCPTAPGPDDGDDPVVHELRMLRIEQAATCDRAFRSAQTAHDDAGQAHDDAQRAHDDDAATRTATHDPLVALRASLTDADNPVLIRPADPQQGDQKVALSTADVDRMQSANAAMHGDLWVLVGVLGGLFFAGFVIRTLAP